MENIKWLWGVMDKRYHKWHILGLIISAVTSLMLLINPYLTMRLMDDVIVAQNPEPLVGLLLTMLIVKVTREGLRYLMVVLLEHSSQNTLMNLRMRLFTRLQYQDMRFFDIHRTGDLMTRLSADTDWCRHFLAYIDYVAVDSIVMFVSSSIYLFSVNWKLALAMVCVTPLLMIITKVYSKGARRMFVDMRDKMSDMNAKAQENIAANRVVKAFAREEYEENRFDERSRAFRDANLDINKRWLSFYPFIEILANAMTLLTVFFGGYLMITDGMTAGELTIFTQLAWTLSVPMRQLGNLLNDWQRFITCSNKVMEIEVSRPEIVDSSCAVNHDHIEGAISFDHVSFAYGSQPVLSDVTFSAKPGQTVLDACAAPGGKTAVLSEMMGDTGRVYAWDTHAHRVELIRGTMNRLKLENVRPAVKDASVPREDMAMTLDAALVDAPCSGTGVMNEKPDVKYRVTEEGVQALCRTQKDILDAIAPMVKVGGTLVYSTCSILPQENEEQIRAFLERHPEYEIQPMGAELPEKLAAHENACGLQMFAHRDGTDGFYVCRMRRVKA